jgi:hypothetical protein
MWWRAYYWVERNFGLIALVAVMTVAVIARKTAGLFESLAPMFFLGGALILLRIFLRTLKVRSLRTTEWFYIAGASLVYAAFVIAALVPWP